MEIQPASNYHSDKTYAKKKKLGTEIVIFHKDNIIGIAAIFL